jgi:hypothetical protein
MEGGTQSENRIHAGRKGIVKASALLLASALALGPVFAWGDDAAVSPAPGAAQQASAPAVDPSRDQVNGPIHVVIQSVTPNGDSLVINGGMATTTPIDVTMYRNFWNIVGAQNFCSATSLGGDPRLPCTTVTLGDNPDHNAPTISMVPGTTYHFSLTIQTHGDAADGLQELRIGLRFGGQWQMLKYPQVRAGGTGAVAPVGVASVNQASGSPASVNLQSAAPVSDSNTPAPQAPAPVDMTNGPQPADNSNPATPNSATPSLTNAAVNVSDTELPAPVTLADKAAEQLMNQLDASISASKWKIAAPQVKQLQAIDKNGYQNTKLSDNLQSIVDDACTTDSAKVQLATMAKPQTPNQYLKRAALEVDAKEAAEAQIDLAIVAKQASKLNMLQQAKLAEEELECAKLTTASGDTNAKQ